MTERSINTVNQYFRKTIPLMVDNNIPITPPYYALWYTYVTHKHPKLNLKIDDLMARFGRCARYQCNDLIQEFIVNDTEAKLATMQSNINQVVQSIGDSTEDAMSSAEDLNETLAKDVQMLAAQADKAALPAAHKMVKIARSFMDKTEDYRAQLAKQNEEIQRLKEKIAETERQIFIDSLTNIYNRRKFNEDLGIYTAAPSETCVVLVDIDHFKPFNDEYGHLVGDKVIQTVAQTLERCCSRSANGAQAYRFGGEEFALLLPNAGMQTATKFANEIREHVSRLNMTNKKTGETLRPITTSLGVAQHMQGDSIDSLLERADTHLYDAKNAGRNCVRPALAS